MRGPEGYESSSDDASEAPVGLRATDVGYEGTIRATFTNWTTPTAYFGNCLGGTGVELQKRIAGVWTPVWSPAQLACLSPPITIPRDGQFQFVIHVFGGYPGGNYRPQFTITDVAGTYRAVWTEVFTNYQIQGPSGEILPVEQRISNQFTIAVQPRP